MVKVALAAGEAFGKALTKAVKEEMKGESRMVNGCVVIIDLLYISF